MEKRCCPVVAVHHQRIDRGESLVEPNDNDFASNFPKFIAPFFHWIPISTGLSLEWSQV